jgi:hypothetical protein
MDSCGFFGFPGFCARRLSALNEINLIQKATPMGGLFLVPENRAQNPINPKNPEESVVQTSLLLCRMMLGSGQRAAQ